MKLISLMVLLIVHMRHVMGTNYLNKTFDEWTWLVAHNSHVNWYDSRVLDAFTNQNEGIEKQLEMGVRGFMFDIDWRTCTGVEKFFKTCKCEGICLCHGECSDLVKDGFGIRNFEYALNIIVSYLNANPTEIVTLFLENYIDDVKKMQQVFNKVKNFNSLVFDPYSSTWNVLQNGWPKIDSMVKANKRILIVDDEKRGLHAMKAPGIIRSRDFFIENHYGWYGRRFEWENFNNSNGLLTKNETYSIVNNSLVVELPQCFSLHKNMLGPLWSEETPLNLTIKENNNQVINGKKLFLLNHFYGIKAFTQTTMSQIMQSLFNTKEFIMKRVEQFCNKGTSNKKPNFIALDFVNSQHYSNLIKPFNTF